MLNVERSANDLRNEFDCAGQADVSAPANIEDAACNSLHLGRSLRRGNRIGDESEISPLGAIAVDDDRSILECGATEAVERHVRTLPRPVDGEVTETDRFDALTPTVRLTEVLCSAASFVTP